MANQLKVSHIGSETTRYRYDNAGRLVAELDGHDPVAEYRYGYRDRVMELVRNDTAVKYQYVESSKSRRQGNERSEVGRSVSGDAPAMNRFTGKPYDEDLQAYVFPFRNYSAKLARWTSADPAGFPDGPNRHFYAPVPTSGLDPLGLKVVFVDRLNADGSVRTSVSSQDEARFHSTMEQIRSEGGVEGQMFYDKVYSDDYTLEVSNSEDVASGGQLSENMGTISLNFSEENFTDMSSFDEYPDEAPPNAAIVLAHEGGHGVYGYNDPGNVAFEDVIRYNMGYSKRETYRGQFNENAYSDVLSDINQNVYDYEN